MTHVVALPAPPCTSRRRVVGGTGVGLVLAMAGVASGASAAQAQDVQDYTVEPGDTVSHIALRSSTSVAAIVAANGLDARATITAGQRIAIPTETTAEPVATPAAPAAAPAATSHTVARGETVSGLATRYGTTTAAIIAANGLDARAMIRIGQVLTVPGATATPAAPAATSAATAGHTVTRGETVSGLATRYGTTTAAIIAANGLDARAMIRIGQVLTVPGAAAAPTAAPVAAPAVSTVAHTVARGETVSALATRYGTANAAIIAANNLDANGMIRIGQVLTVPGNAAPTASLVGSTFAGRSYPAATVASANENKATLLAIGVPSRTDMQALVATTARDMGVDPALAQAIAYQESGFNHTAVSPANAIGTMQVIPTSGQWAGELIGRDLNLLDPRDNVTAGVAILGRLVATSPDLPTAIAGYYQGQAGVAKYGMYADTRRYVASVQTLMSRFS
ncbi:LysM peptidoglycan-binding domain-containing protein [Cellulomonas sp. KRMCY2]|uniref:LysM peptidoglycan-binding domain-containing protein n=1 Tax=Cellulomonas sp. KRMCY2 TaxID=1304865 RepID=UPI0009DCF058|nr:LysM peptidoglycan-binding domain-containing protein [Cellulomonas sp. KRMCY2]